MDGKDTTFLCIMLALHKSINRCQLTNESIKKIIYNLILTHGLIGQYIRGEVPLLANMPLYQLVEEGIITASELKRYL